MESCQIHKKILCSINAQLQNEKLFLGAFLGVFMQTPAGVSGITVLAVSNNIMQIELTRTFNLQVIKAWYCI